MTKPVKKMRKPSPRTSEVTADRQRTIQRCGSSQKSPCCVFKAQVSGCNVLVYRRPATPR